MMERGRRKSLVGVVVSNKMDKTAVVAVERRVRHSLYRKIIRRTTRYKAHDATNSAVLGDVVRLEETRPLSKDKRWRIAQTLTRGNVAELAPREIGAPEEETTEAPVAVEAAVAAPVSQEPAGEATTAEETTAVEATAAEETASAAPPEEAVVVEDTAAAETVSEQTTVEETSE